MCTTNMFSDHNVLWDTQNCAVRLHLYLQKKLQKLMAHIYIQLKPKSVLHTMVVSGKVQRISNDWQGLGSWHGCNCFSCLIQVFMPQIE